MNSKINSYGLICFTKDFVGLTRNAHEQKVLKPFVQQKYIISYEGFH